MAKTRNCTARRSGKKKEGNRELGRGKKALPVQWREYI